MLTHDEKQRFKPHSSAWQDFNEFLAHLMPGDVWIVKVLRQKTLLRFELLECSSTVSCPSFTCVSDADICSLQLKVRSLPPCQACPCLHRCSIIRLTRWRIPLPHCSDWCSRTAPYRRCQGAPILCSDRFGSVCCSWRSQPALIPLHRFRGIILSFFLPSAACAVEESPLCEW